MPFIEIEKVPPLTLLPGCRLRTPYGQKIMLSYLEMDEGVVIPRHQHPHEQAEMLLQVRLTMPKTLWPSSLTPASSAMIAPLSTTSITPA